MTRAMLYDFIIGPVDRVEDCIGRDIPPDEWDLATQAAGRRAEARDCWVDAVLSRGAPWAHRLKFVTVQGGHTVDDDAIPANQLTADQRSEAEEIADQIETALMDSIVCRARWGML